MSCLVQCDGPLLRLESEAAGGQGVGVGLPQNDPVPEQFEKDVVVTEEDEAQGQSVVPAFGPQQRVELVQDHAGLDPDQQVQDPQRFMEQNIKPGMGHVGGQGHVVRSHSFIQSPAVSHQHPLRPNGTVRPHMLRGVAVRAVLQFLPSSEVSCRAVQQVAVTGRQQLTHEHYEGVDPHHDEVLTGPSHVVVLCALDEAEGEEGHVVGTEERVEQHFLDPPVEVALELLHLGADHVGGVRVQGRRAFVCGHEGRAGELLAEVFT